MKQKTKLIIILAVEFVAISIVLLMIFLAGKKSYTVTFDLNGGILLSGDTVQRITQGQSATPPNVAKDGHYLRGWSGNYRKVTSDSTVRAIWEYETTPGIIYGDSENQNFAEIVGSFKEIHGEVYIGAYHDEKIVLSINSGAFRDRTEITEVHLLDGILSIESEAFAGCTKMKKIDIPSTVVRLGAGAFEGCKSLESVTLPASLVEIEEGAFAGCESLSEIIFVDRVKDKDGKMENISVLEKIGAGAFSGCKSVETVVLPESLKEIGTLAFSGCEKLAEVTVPLAVESIGVGAFNTDNLTINLFFSEGEIPEGFAPLWYTGDGVKLVYDYQPPEPEDTEEDEKNPWWDLGGKDEDKTDEKE